MLFYKWQPAPFGISMAAGFFAFWFVSILTKPEEKERIDTFFENMRRKSDTKEPWPNGQKPLASETGDDLMLLDLPGWKKKERRAGFLKRYREDLAGFILSWAIVGFLILLAWAILQIR